MIAILLPTTGQAERVGIDHLQVCHAGKNCPDTQLAYRAGLPGIPCILGHVGQDCSDALPSASHTFTAPGQCTHVARPAAHRRLPGLVEIASLTGNDEFGLGRAPRRAVRDVATIPSHQGSRLEDTCPSPHRVYTQRMGGVIKERVRDSTDWSIAGGVPQMARGRVICRHLSITAGSCGQRVQVPDPIPGRRLLHTSPS